MINIIGIMPPPFGGVSVHLLRFCAYLSEQEIEYRVHDVNGGKVTVRYGEAFIKMSLRKWVLKLLFTRKFGSKFHIHVSSNLQFSLALILSALDKKTLITFHNQRLMTTKKLKDRLLLSVFNWLKKKVLVICVSHGHYEQLKNEGFQVFYVPAYIKPSKKEVSNQSEEVLSKIANNKKTICLNIWHYSKELADKVYGFDILFNHCIKNPNLYRDTQLNIFVGDQTSDIDHLEHRLQAIAVDHIVHVGISLTAYLLKMDILLRLNRKDAYGVSIKESLDLGVDVVATNVCKRPEGCILFDSEVNGEFEKIVERFLKSLPLKRDSEVIITNYEQELLSIYEKFCFL